MDRYIIHWAVTVLFFWPKPVVFRRVYGTWDLLVYHVMIAAPYPGGIDPRLAVYARSWDGHYTTTRRDRLSCHRARQKTNTKNTKTNKADKNTKKQTTQTRTKTKTSKTKAKQSAIQQSVSQETRVQAARATFSQSHGSKSQQDVVLSHLASRRWKVKRGVKAELRGWTARSISVILRLKKRKPECKGTTFAMHLLHLQNLAMYRESVSTFADLSVTLRAAPRNVQRVRFSTWNQQTFLRHGDLYIRQSAMDPLVLTSDTLQCKYVTKFQSNLDWQGLDLQWPDPSRVLRVLIEWAIPSEFSGPFGSSSGPFESSFKLVGFYTTFGFYKDTNRVWEIS